MVNLRELLRMHEGSHKNCQIARILGISRSVVAKYLTLLSVGGLTYDKVKDLPDDKVMEIVTGSGNAPPENRRYQELAEMFPYFVRELKKTGVTLQRLHSEYLIKRPDGYEYSQRI